MRMLMPNCMCPSSPGAAPQLTPPSGLCFVRLNRYVPGPELGFSYDSAPRGGSPAPIINDCPRPDLDWIQQSMENIGLACSELFRLLVLPRTYQAGSSRDALASAPQPGNFQVGHGTGFHEPPHKALDWPQKQACAPMEQRTSHHCQRTRGRTWVPGNRA